MFDEARYRRLRVALSHDPAALAELDRLDRYGLTRRVSRFSDDELLAHIRNNVDQRARRVSHDTGATL